MTVTAVRARAPLSRARIVQEALRIIDAEGVAALSMRKLGAALQVEAMSLYRHVRGKEALLDAIHAALLEELVPTGDAVGWRGYLGAVARGLRDVLRRHPHAVPLFTRRSPREAVTVEVAETLFRRMRDMGMSHALRLQALEAVTAFVLGHALAHAAPASARPYDAHAYPVLAEVMAAAVTWHFDHSFEVGLQALLDGLEQARVRARR